MSKKILFLIGAVAVLAGLCVVYQRTQLASINNLQGGSAPAVTPAPSAAGSAAATAEIIANSAVVDSLAGVLMYGVVDTRALEEQSQKPIGFLGDLLKSKTIAEILTATPVKGGATPETAKKRIDDFLAWWSNLEKVELAVKRDGFTMKSKEKNVNLPSISAVMHFSTKEQAIKTRADIVAELSDRSTKTGKFELKKVEGSEDVELRANELPDVPLMTIAVDNKLLRASMFNGSGAEVSGPASNPKKLEDIIAAVGTSRSGLMFFQDYEQASEQLSVAAEPIAELLNLDEATKKHFVSSIKDLSEYGQRGFRLSASGNESRACFRPAANSVEATVSENVIRRQSTKHRFLSGVDKETLFAGFDVNGSEIIAMLDKLAEKPELTAEMGKNGVNSSAEVIAKIKTDLEKLNFGELGLAINPPVIPPFIGAVIYLGGSTLKGPELLNQVASLINNIAAAVPSASTTPMAAKVEGNKITFSVAGYKITGLLEGENSVVFAMDESIAAGFAAKLAKGEDFYAKMGGELPKYLSSEVASVSSINGDAVVNLLNSFLPLLTMGNPQIDTAEFDPFINRLRANVVVVKKMEKVGSDIYCMKERTFIQ